MEQHNLKWSVETRKHDLPFDANELNDYEFMDSNYLGKDKICIVKATKEAVEQSKALEIIHKSRLRNEHGFDFSNSIISLIRNAMTLGAVRTYCEM